MRLTSINVVFKNHYTIEDIFQIIYMFDIYPKVSNTIKLIRRYRHNIVGIGYYDKNVYAITFHFPKREKLLSFREELSVIEEELLK